MLRTLRSRLILSHILPLVVIVPLMYVALSYLLETRFLIPKLAQDLLNDARLLTDFSRKAYLATGDMQNARFALAAARAEPAGAVGFAGIRWQRGFFQRSRLPVHR